MANILIIDDDKALCSMLSRTVKRLGHDSGFALTLKDGLSALHSGRFDVVFLDVELPDGDGLKVLPEIRQTPSSPEVVIITGFGDPDGVEIAIKSGAWDYLEKPFMPTEVSLCLQRILQYREAILKVQKPVRVLKLDGIIGNSQKMKHCYDGLAQAAASDVNVIITGETGTGKELFARSIHANSIYAKKNFVVVDCAALPPTLVESMLFGHEKGAFTGAEKSQDGLIKQADGGTLFLDEVGELPLAVQKSFLRVLQERCFRPIGGKNEVKSHFRLISATHRDLDQMIEKGQFREDLLYRLRSVVIKLPPLKERKEDIREMVMYFMNRLCENHGMGLKGFSPDFFDIISSYDWPGNVRELNNVTERAFAEAKIEPVIFPKHLPNHIRIRFKRASVGEKKSFPATESRQKQPIPSKIPPSYRDFRESVISDAEKRYFEDLIAHTQGNIKDACRISGLGRSRLYTLLNKYGVSRTGWPKADSRF
jgi:two-component system NtrC family response regulator